MNPNTTPTVSVTATPIQNWSNPVNYNMGTFQIPTAQPKAPEPPKIDQPKPGAGIISDSSMSAAADAKTISDVNSLSKEQAALTEQNTKNLAVLEQQRIDLEKRREADLATINTNFGQARDKLVTNQAGETGTYTATLARMGGYLGNTASSTGALITLNQKHQVQLSELEAKKQEAIQIANNAINDKQFALATSKIAEIKDYTTQMQKARQDFFNQNKKLIEDQTQAKKDAAVAELYAGGVTDIPTILKSLSGSGLSVTSTDVQNTLKNLVPTAVNDLIETLNKSGAPADVKMKVLGAKNVNDAYIAAGPWASIGGTGIIGEYNYYKAETIAKGLTPVSFDEFQTKDANRKAGITATYSGGSAYTTPGASGEYGAYQFMPDTWKDYAGQILNDPTAPMTPANQDAVAQGMVAKWLGDGKTAEQIARKWNSGDFNKTGSGVNSKGIPWDVDAYVKRFKEMHKSIGGGNDAISIARAIKLTETGKSGDVPTERVVNIVLGSGKFTASQRADFINSMNAATNPADAFAIVKNKGRELLTETTATKVEAAEKSQAAFIAMIKAFEEYYAGGGDSNLVEGKFQDVQNKLAKISGDPKLVYLAVNVETAMQSYRNAISGTAYSVQEGQDIRSIFPNISNTQLLNETINQARRDYFEKDINSSYESVFGPAYTKLKEEADKFSQGTITEINQGEEAAKKQMNALIPTLDTKTQDSILKLYDSGFTESQVLEYLKLNKKI